MKYRHTNMPKDSYKKITKLDDTYVTFEHFYANGMHPATETLRNYYERFLNNPHIRLTILN